MVKYGLYQRRMLKAETYFSTLQCKFHWKWEELDCSILCGFYSWDKPQQKLASPQRSQCCVLEQSMRGSGEAMATVSFYISNLQWREKEGRRKWQLLQNLTGIKWIQMKEQKISKPKLAKPLYFNHANEIYFRLRIILGIRFQKYTSVFTQRNWRRI